MSQLSDCCNKPITERIKANGDRENICSLCHHIVLIDVEKAIIINKKSSKWFFKKTIK